MTPREELNLILELIRKYNLPLSPILEYAVNEKKEEFPEENIVPLISEYKDENVIETTHKQDGFTNEESATIELTRELIEAARTPNGGFTKSQLAVLGISWPAPIDWIDEKVGTFITPKQLEDFNHIEYVVKKSSKVHPSYFSNSSKTYKDVAFCDSDMKCLEAVLRAMDHFDVPTTPRDVARTVSRSAWGGVVHEKSVDAILKRLPEIEYIPYGKYILKKKINQEYKNNQENIIKGCSIYESARQNNSVLIEDVGNIIKDQEYADQHRLVSPINKLTEITLELIKQMVEWDKQHKVLDDWKCKVMEDVVEGRKEFTESMKYAFYLNLQALKKKGFHN